MSDLSNYTFQQPGGAGPDPQGPFGDRRVQIAAGLGVLVVAAAALYFMFGRSPAETPVADATPAPAAAPAPVAPAPAELAPALVVLPELDATDALVRELVRALSSHPRVAAWLATDDLIRNFTVSVENLSNGQTPASHLQVLRPDGDYPVLRDDETVIADTRGYARYAGLADAVDGIDAQGAARLYATRKPRIQEAYEELGYQQSFDVALERALVLLLRTPVSDNIVLLESAGALWAYSDPGLEGLEPAQKQLLRMGPRNARVVQARLRAIALAIGIPAARLP
jgi:hypothetical protein